MKSILTGLMLTILLVGCSRKDDNATAPPKDADRLNEALQETPKEQNQEQSDVGLVLDAVTGKQAVDRGRDMTDKINKIQADRQKQLEELDAFE